MTPMNNRLMRPYGGRLPVAPVVTLQLSEGGTATASVGDTLTFTSSASGDPEPTATWQESTDNGVTWTTVQEG